jgi:predicted PurR-regulated permease PerM
MPDVVIMLSTWWTVGWAVAAMVILLVAVLILTITALARKINGEAQQLVTDLDSIAHKTRPLHDVGRTNIAVQTITRGLRFARGEAPALDKYRTSPGWRE